MTCRAVPRGPCPGIGIDISSDRATRRAQHSRPPPPCSPAPGTAMSCRPMAPPPGHAPRCWTGAPPSRGRRPAGAGASSIHPGYGKITLVRPQHGAPAARWRAVSTPQGSRTRNTVSPGRLSTPISPPCRSTMRREMSRPRPVPLPTPLVVKNGSNAWCLRLVGHPGAGVADLHNHAFAVGTRRHPKRAVALHRVESVVDEVRPHLVELAGERLDPRDVGAVVARRR